MSNLIIVIAVLIAVIALSVYCFLYIKKKIRNKVIDKGAEIITKTSGKYLGNETASKVNRATNTAAETLKKGNANAIKAIAKKGLEVAKQ